MRMRGGSSTSAGTSSPSRRASSWLSRRPSKRDFNRSRSGSPRSRPASRGRLKRRRQPTGEPMRPGARRTIPDGPMRLSPRHPRYRSLVVRTLLAEAARTGLVVPEGLIAHGRGEAFDYLLGERTSASARRAERVAAQWLRAARRPVLSVNGNVAALAADGVARLQKALPTLGVEVNLFHRSPHRVDLVAHALRDAGVKELLGVRPTARIPGLPSDRAHVDRRGIFVADVCLVPLEDGDRTEALRALGKRVISIDLNPLSRTSRSADL